MGKFLFPLENGAYDINNSERVHGAKTYSNHGVGKLDFYASPGDVVRSMTNGKVLKAGKDSSTEYTSCDILVSGDYWKPNSVDGLVIRYYHIVDFPVSVGDVVNQGDILGYVDEKQVGTTGAHLHLDFCNYVDGTYYLGKGPNLMGPRLNTEQLTYEQEQAISLWQGQHGSNNGWGRCWEVIATPAVYQEQSQNSDSTMNAFEKLKLTDDDMLAVYGMLLYEESGCAKRITDAGGIDSADEKDVAICEWVVRCFRNRLICGSSISDICAWDRGNPGIIKAKNFGRRISDIMREFCLNIIKGNNYFFVEKVAKKYFYDGLNEGGITENWYNHLYAACMFYGGVDRGYQTLAAIPFSDGTFAMEGGFNKKVQKYWNQGFFINPYSDR